ncbi:Hypothetical_protein [Hexamita inflata]|uniref:Hypothetical_protein n=1 Tax=Hexamita inflata TaxID=28002 RepID=A0AA86P6E7_9EUKA|nr:Hypothetical protein HINF_LOCUS20285 [Hexamita inflata]CAI9932641.1 Hypothetical protein HINF_LOCUS20286 [Hexamita inflata]
MYQVNQFAVFGFNSNTQNITDSHIFVKINYTILTGALICLECDIYAKSSNLQFIASGLQLSALILKSKQYIELSDVNISFRFNCNYSSGIVNQINSKINIFSIYQSALIGFNTDNILNGYICSKLYIQTNIIIIEFKVCVNENMQSVGIAEQSLNISGTSTLTCYQLCDDEQIVTFGICYGIIQFATTLDNFTQICSDPFIFDSFNNICVCQYGYYLNGSICVNVINEFSEIMLNISSIYVKLHTEIQQTDLELKSIFYDFEQNIQTNISNLSKLVSETHLDLKLDINTTNQTLHNTMKDLQTDVDFKLKFNSDQNVITQAIIKQFYIETSNNFSAVSTKLGSVSTLIIDNNLNITNYFMKTQTQISDLQNEIGSNFSQVGQAIDGLIIKITSLSDKIDKLNLAATGCKTIGATEEGDGLCTCTTKFGNIQSSYKNGFNFVNNMCCTQYMYLSEALICSDGQQYYHYVELRQYTNVPW